jgi:hypothetical protein
MKNLQDATEKICELKGSLVAMDALLASMLKVLPDGARQELLNAFVEHAEVARTVLLHAPISELTIAAFERDVRRNSALMGALPVE